MLTQARILRMSGYGNLNLNERKNRRFRARPALAGYYFITCGKLSVSYTKILHYNSSLLPDEYKFKGVPFKAPL